MRKPFFGRLKERWLHILYGYVCKLSLNLIAMTCRFRVEGLNHLLTNAGKKNCILMLWHHRLIITAQILKRFSPQFNYAAMISDSRDGEIISVLANSYPNGSSIRVPHTSRSIALRTLIKNLQSRDDVIIITPDGPRGPPLQIKPGIALAARKSSALVIPMTWKAERCWKLPTWDGLLLPKPFASIHVTFGEPVEGATMEAGSLEDSVALLQAAMRKIEPVAKK